MAAPANASSTRLDPLVAAAFAALDKSGTAWCVLRGEDRLDRPPNDVDLLVAPGGMAGAQRALLEAGFAPQPLRSPHRLLAAYEPEDDRWLRLDVVTELAYGRPPVLRAPVAATCLDRRTRVQGVPLLELEDRFWTELLHVALDRDDVPPAACHRLAILAEQIDPRRGPLAAWVETRLGAEAPTRLSTLAARGEWSTLCELVARALPPQRPRRRPRLRAVRRLRSRLAQPGVSVALVGPDGAGKSTVAAALAAEIPLANRCFYMGLQPGASVPGKTWIPLAPPTAPHRRRPLPVRLVRQWRRLLRLARRSAAAWVSVQMGRLVIFDRYPYDAEVHWSDASGPGGHLRRWLIRRAVLRPDLVVLLDVPGEITFARKREHSPELLEQRRQRYLDLATRLERTQVVDGTLSQDEVRRIVTSLVWTAYVAKHARRRRLPGV